jgi:endonuclease YncB( thermonuclease family)
MKRAPARCGRERVREALLAMLALVGATWFAVHPAMTEERTSCPLDPGPTRAVIGVMDAETLVLDDGSELRLIGALAPRPPDAVLDVSYWPPERDAKAALEKLVLGHSVTLAFSGRRSDRYGRTLAHVFLKPDDAGDRVWLQARMLADGHARAFVLKDSLGCLRELAAHEAVARRTGVGLWLHAAYQIREASCTQDLTRLRSTFQLVEG